MNKSVLILNFALLFVFNACQQRIDVEKEKAAIIAVIEEETDAFYDRDLERLTACHLQDRSNIRLTANRAGYGYTEGWQDSDIKDFFDENPEPDQSKEVKSNYKIKVYPESAWAVYDNEYYNVDGELTGKGIHSQFFEKQDGKWKIAYLSIIGTSSYINAEDNQKAANLYHQFNPEDIDNILTDDFVGRNEQSRFTWTKENHKNYWSTNSMEASDTVYYQVADGNWVATLFERRAKYNGKDVQAQVMHFKRFENGKIAEIYEFGDSRQWE